MKTIVLFTKESILASKVSKDIISNYPFSKKITKNDETELFVGKYPNEAYIIFNDTLPISDKSCLLSDEEKALIPFKPVQFNVVYYRNILSAKAFVKTILKFYPELYIFNEEKDALESASVFLEK